MLSANRPIPASAQAASAHSASGRWNNGTNGFGNRSAKVAASLPFTTGALLTAARLVLETSGVRVACAPVSGFHHAGHARAAGFCTFNGLIVAARHLQTRGIAQRIGILDLDQHHSRRCRDVLRPIG